MNPIARYTHWLHTQWPAGKPETLPRVREDFSTNVPGLYVVGDLAGVPLFKFSADSGARAVRTILADPAFQNRPQPSAMDSMSGIEPPYDLVIIGAGVAGMSAALEAKKAGLRFLVVESAQAFSTVHNFLRGKPIYTYPTDMTPAGDLRITGATREQVLDELHAQTLAQGIVPAIGEATAVRRRQGLLEVEVAAAAAPDPEDIMIEPEEATRRVRGPHIPRPLMAHRVIVAIGRSGAHRVLNVPGEDLPKVYNRLHDPADFHGQRVLVVGGGDSALETAIALASCGAHVTLSYRRRAFSRPKPENVEMVRTLADARRPDSLRESGAPRSAPEIEKPDHAHESAAIGDWMRDKLAPGSLTLRMGSNVVAIREDAVDLRLDDGSVETLPNDSVFTMIGHHPPLDFFRRSGVTIAGERDLRWWATLVAFLAFCFWLYHWKKSGVTILPFAPFTWLAESGSWWRRRGWFPYNVPEWWASLGEAFNNPAHLLGTMKVSLGEPGFYYSLVYCLCVVFFGIDRIRRRRTPYVKWQTITLALIQVVPLFLLPYIVLPWMGHNGAFAPGTWSGWIADEFFPRASYGHGREYWRAFGLILAWPLFIWNVFTSQPLWGWLILSFVQTFVIIPAIVYFWGKGAYCGWICSCGALAETLGDRHRWKMPHGPWWNRLNMLGQAFLAFAFVLLIFRALGWAMGPRSWPARTFSYLFDDIPLVNYVWFVDLFWAGVLGVGLYFWFSGRVWCRFACPLAAWMHIVHRFSRFRILADKKKCISCNVCTSVCHQGIDIMSFANKGEPMADPQCVRCSACVQMCPTGVLTFGQVDRRGNVIKEDPSWLAASPVRMTELTVNGKRAVTAAGGSGR